MRFFHFLLLARSPIGLAQKKVKHINEKSAKDCQLQTEAMRGWLQSQRADYLVQLLEVQGISMGASRPLRSAMVDFALAIGVHDLEHVMKIDSSLPENIVCIRTVEVGMHLKSQ